MTKKKKITDNRNLYPLLAWMRCFCFNWHGMTGAKKKKKSAYLTSTWIRSLGLGWDMLEQSSHWQIREGEGGIAGMMTARQTNGRGRNRRMERDEVKAAVLSQGIILQASKKQKE